MRGKESDTVGGEFYQGTSKGAEGYAPNISFQGAKEEGMHIEVQWQDGDSSAAKAFREHFTNESRSRVMLCGGHVARLFTKNLGEFAKQKSFLLQCKIYTGNNFLMLILSNAVAPRDTQRIVDVYLKVL